MSARHPALPLQLLICNEAGCDTQWSRLSSFDNQGHNDILVLFLHPPPSSQPPQFISLVHLHHSPMLGNITMRWSPSCDVDTNLIWPASDRVVHCYSYLVCVICGALLCAGGIWPWMIWGGLLMRFGDATLLKIWGAIGTHIFSHCYISLTYTESYIAKSLSLLCLVLSNLVADIYHYFGRKDGSRKNGPKCWFKYLIHMIWWDKKLTFTCIDDSFFLNF